MTPSNTPISFNMGVSNVPVAQPRNYESLTHNNTNTGTGHHLVKHGYSSNCTQFEARNCSTKQHGENSIEQYEGRTTVGGLNQPCVESPGTGIKPCLSGYKPCRSNCTDVLGSEFCDGSCTCIGKDDICDHHRLPQYVGNGTNPYDYN